MSYRLVHHAQDGPGTGNHGRRPHNLRRRVARQGLTILPTLCTLGNLLCGCAAIFMASRPADMNLPFNWTPLTFAAVLVFGGMLFDALDGRLARLTRNISDLGAQLDSMADMVTFGVAPAFMAVQLVGIGVPFITVSDVGDRYFDRITLVIAGIYAACAALRLARFNIEADASEDSDHGSFNGLPTPGAAGTVASLVLLHQHFLAHYPPVHWSLGVAAAGMVTVTLLTALAMISRFRYVHMMNRYVRGRAPIETIAHGVIIALLLAVNPQATLAAAFVFYALSAPVISLYRRTLSLIKPARAVTEERSAREDAQDMDQHRRDTG